MESIKYITSLLTFYLKGEISTDGSFVTFKEPNTILGLIPLGAKKVNVPINQISSTQTNFKMKFGKFILGIVVAIFALMCLKNQVSSILGIVLLVVAVNLIIDAFEIDLDVIMTSGVKKSIDFFIFDKSKADSADRMISDLVSIRLSDTNTRRQTDKIVEAINNK